MQSENVGQAADTSRSSCQQTESSCGICRNVPAVNRSGDELVTYLSSTFWCHIDVEEALSANRHSSTPGNHDAMPPLQCLAKRENDSTPTAFLLEVKGSIVQFHLFEYEMSRGLLN